MPAGFLMVITGVGFAVILSARNSNAIKPQPQQLDVCLRFTHGGKIRFSLHKKAGASDKSGVWRPGSL